MLRRQRITSASSLSVSGRELVPSSWVVVGSVLETLGSRGVSDWWFGPCVLRHRVTVLHAMPPRRTRNSDRPRASDRTMVATELNRLPSFKSRRRYHHSKMNRGNGRAIQRKTSRAIESHLQTVGWISRQNISRLPAEGEVFLLTSPFIEPPISD